MVKDSCGGRGCEYNRKMPYDDRFNLVYSGVLQVEYDIEAVFSVSQFDLDQKLAKEGQIKKIMGKASRVVRVLPVSMDSYVFIYRNIGKDDNCDYELWNNIFNN